MILKDRNHGKVKLPRDAGPHGGTDMEWWYCYSFLDDDNDSKYAVIISFFKAGIIPFNKGCYILFSLIDQKEKTQTGFSLLDKKLILNMNLLLFPTYFHCIPGNEDIKRISERYKKYNVGPNHILTGRTSFQKNPVNISCGSNFLKYIDEKTGKFEVNVSEDDVEIELSFNPQKPPAFIGGDGKPNQLYYYSYTNNYVYGKIIHKGSMKKVTGKGWFDHQWGNARGLLTGTGWNWFGIQLEDGRELMVTELGSLYTGEVFSPSANMVEKDGSLKATDSVTIEPVSFWRSPLTGACYPLEWNISIPEFSIYIKVSPDFPAQEIPAPFPLQSIWEGTCSVSGYEKIDVTLSKSVSGRCFMELVGYASF